MSVLFISCRKDGDTGTALTPEQSEAQSSVLDLQRSSWERWVALRSVDRFPVGPRFNLPVPG